MTLQLTQIIILNQIKYFAYHEGIEYEEVCHLLNHMAGLLLWVSKDAMDIVEAKSFIHQQKLECLHINRELYLCPQLRGHELDSVATFF